MAVTIQLKSRGRPIKRLPSSVDVNPNAPVSELASKISSATGLSVHRLRLTKASDGSVLTSLNLENQTTVNVKDLGPQIGWRTVFIIEYLGPLLIHPLFFIPTLRTYLYPHLPASIATAPPTATQALLLTLTVIHFVKRELETMYVHKFSSATMPWRNLPKNSTHYWILSGVNLAWFLYHPLNTVEGKFSYWNPSAKATYILTALWVFAELSNYWTHLTLSSLRPAGTTERGIPTGYGFNWVTCPNYFFETMSWVFVWGLSGFNWAAGLFTLISAGQMYLWALKKEKKYRQEFPDKYKKKRFVMIPWLL
ncbi:synaptic glycoprotein SC2 [Kalaharituber pfeilii]|nr:synaptic glycoprotein SC2 [Kalaharituber pfeilii]